MPLIGTDLHLGGLSAQVHRFRGSRSAGVDPVDALPLQQARVFVLYEAIAFAAQRLESPAIERLDNAALLADCFRVLQFSGALGNAFTAYTKYLKYLRDQCLSHRQLVVRKSIPRTTTPPRPLAGPASPR